MRSIIIAIFLTICCIVVYTNAAALPEIPSATPDSAVQIDSDEINKEEDASEYNGEENNNSDESAQARTLFLLLPLLFPDEFYF